MKKLLKAFFVSFVFVMMFSVNVFATTNEVEANDNMEYMGISYLSSSGDQDLNPDLAEVNTNDLADAEVTGLTDKTYTGKAIKQDLTVKLGNNTLRFKKDYTVKYKNNKKAGTATVTIKAKGKTYKGSKTVYFTINKADNPLSVTGKTAKVKIKSLSKKDQKLSVSKVIKVNKKGQGKLSYEKKTGDSRISIDRNKGKVTVKKGLGEGTYPVTVEVTAAGKPNYNPGTKTVTFYITVGSSTSQSKGRTEVTIEASEEIKTAPLSSGKKQILDDVFQCGGYITVDDFIEKYSDKYDFSKIQVDSYASVGWNRLGQYEYDEYTAVRKDLYYDGGKIYKCKDENERIEKNGSPLVITIYSCKAPEKHFRVGDCIVNEVYLNTEKYCWYPGGLMPDHFENGDGMGYDYKNFEGGYIKNIATTEGLTEIDWDIRYYSIVDRISELTTWPDGKEVTIYPDDPAKKQNLGKIIRVNCYMRDKLYDGNYSGYYYIGVMSKDINLYGKKPVFTFAFHEKSSNGKMYFQYVRAVVNYESEPIEEKVFKEKYLDS